MCVVIFYLIKYVYILFLYLYIYLQVSFPYVIQTMNMSVVTLPNDLIKGENPYHQTDLFRKHLHGK